MTAASDSRNYGQQDEAATRPTTRVLRRLLASGVHARAERLLERIHPADLGPLLSSLTPDEIRTCVDLLFKHRRAAPMLIDLPPEIRPQVLDALTDDRLAQVLARLELDDILGLFEAVPEERRQALRDLLPREVQSELRNAELYPESSAGRVMTTSFVALDEKMSAQEAIDSIRAAGDAVESILYLYVVDDLQRLRGVVPIRRLVASPASRSCGDLMIPDPIRTPPEADQEEVARLVARYDLLAVPVTDVDDTLLGVITVDDVIDVIHEEATEDMYHLAGLSDEDRIFSSARRSIAKRLPWTLVNLVTVFLAAQVVGLFESTLTRLVPLAVFLPIVAGMGGNGGIQTLTIITRAIALGEIEFSSGLRAVLKEAGVGLVMGAIAGTLSAGFAWLWMGNATLGLVLFTALVVTMMVASLLGAAIPLGLKALRLDPAVGSGPLVIFVTDATGFFTFLGIATLLIDRLV